MNWNIIEGKWDEYKGKVKQLWGKLTDDDITVIKGKRDQLAGKLRERYGYAQDRAEEEINKFMSSCDGGTSSSCSSSSKASNY